MNRKSRESSSTWANDPDGIEGLRLRLAEAQADRDEGWERVREVRRVNARLREAVRPILAAYRSWPADVTQEQITEAWAAYDEAGL